MWSRSLHWIAAVTLLALALPALAQPTWKYVESPKNCEFYECVWSTDGVLYCASEQCGLWRYRLSTGEFDSLSIRPLSSSRVIPRSIDIDDNGKVHVVGAERARNQSLNRELTPFYCTSTDGGDSWQHVSLQDSSYGSYQVTRCMQNGTVLIGAELRYPRREYQTSYDSVNVTVFSVSDTGASAVTLSRTHSDSPDMVPCQYRGDYYTVAMTTDRYAGVAEEDLAPCQQEMDDPSRYPHYSFRTWLSTDGGKSFPDSVSPKQKYYFTSRGNRLSISRNYLAHDYWIIEDSVSKDQGSSKYRDQRTLSDGSRTIVIDYALTTMINGRFAIDLFYERTKADSIRTYTVGRFSLDGSDWIIEHKQEVVAYYAYSPRGTSNGYAVVPFPKGLLIRIPDPSTKVEEIPRQIVKVYPNPGEDMVTITGLTSDQEVMVMTMQGRVVYTAKSFGYSVSLDLSALAVGSYLVRTSESDTQQLLQVIR